jgi:hypothetical protein
MTGKRYAIIVGSNNYATENLLRYPFDDIKSMKQILIDKCKFTFEDIEPIRIEIGDQNNQQKIIDYFDVIAKKISEDIKQGYIIDSCLFYFSGHGVNQKLLLSETEELPIQTVYEYLTALNCKNKYMIIDACQSGFKPNIAKGLPSNAFLTKAQGEYILTATTDTLSAYELSKWNKNIKNGVFTHFFIAALNNKTHYTTINNQKMITMSKIKGEVELQVAHKNNMEQLITYYENSINNIPHPFAFWDEKEEEIKPKEKIKPIFNVDSSDYELVDLATEHDVTFSWNLFFSLLDNYENVKGNPHLSYFEPISKIIKPSKRINELIKLSNDEILFFIETLHTNLTKYNDWEHYETWNSYAEIIFKIYDKGKDSLTIQVAAFSFLWYLAVRQSFDAKNILRDIFRNKVYNEKTKDFYILVANDIYERRIKFDTFLYDEIANEVTVPKPIRDVNKRITEDEIANNPPYDPLTNDNANIDLPF